MVMEDLFVRCSQTVTWCSPRQSATLTWCPQKTVHRKFLLYIYILAHQPHSGLGRGYEITIRHTRHGRTVLDEESARRRDNTRHSQETDFHSPNGIRSYNPSKRVAADLRHRRRGHLDRPSIIQYFNLPPDSIHRHKLRWTLSGTISGVLCVSYRAVWLLRGAYSLFLKACVFCKKMSVCYQLDDSEKKHGRRNCRKFVYIKHFLGNVSCRNLQTWKIVASAFIRDVVTGRNAIK